MQRPAPESPVEYEPSGSDWKPIECFADEFRFLSNFWPATVELDGVMYASVEHAYQAAKSEDLALREVFAGPISAGSAKRKGSKLVVRPDWGECRIATMRNLLVQKFRIPDLARRLIGTYPRPIVEGNHWGDVFWGVCDGVGTNHLGQLLMEIRENILLEGEYSPCELFDAVESQATTPSP